MRDVRPRLEKADLNSTNTAYCGMFSVFCLEISTMDCRLTLGVNETFYEVLQNAFLAAEKVYLLVEDEGLNRREGFIAILDTKNAVPFLKFQSGERIELKSLVAVNGLFLSSYGEC